jgi:AAA domain-containing protein
VINLAGDRAAPPDRVTVERTAQELILGMTRRPAPTGVSVVIEGAPGIGKTFLSLEILASVPPGQAKILRVAGQQGRRNDPCTLASQLLGELTGDTDPADAAFDHVDELCADGPVVLCADDAHHLDAASLTLLRRLVWASRTLPLAVLVTTRPGPFREPLAMLIRQAQVRLWLPPMGAMMVERLVFDQTGRWPGPLLCRILGLAAGNPLFVGELLRGYRNAGALTDAGPDAIEARFELDLQTTGLDEVIQAHLAELDEPTRDVLAAIAVWGPDIGVDDLASMVFVSADTLGELLERAVSSGLVRRDPTGTAGFSHDLFREVTYRGLAEAQRRAGHRRAAEVLTAAGYRPSLIADHLLRAAGTDGDPALMAALRDAVAATRRYAPEVTAGLLDDVAAVGADVPGALVLDHADALFRQGRGEAAETLIRERIATVTDPTVAARLQLILIRSLMNRADVAAARAAIERTAAIAGLPAATVRQLEGTRAGC